MSYIYVILVPFFLMILSYKCHKYEQLELLKKIENLFLELKDDRPINYFFNCFLYIRKFLFSVLIGLLYKQTKLQLILIISLNILLILIMIIKKPYKE